MTPDTKLILNHFSNSNTLVFTQTNRIKLTRMKRPNVVLHMAFSVIERYSKVPIECYQWKY